MIIEKKLYRSKTDKKLASVCGGLAEYIGMDSSIVCIILALLTILYGTRLLHYIVCALVTPVEQ